VVDRWTCGACRTSAGRVSVVTTGTRRRLVTVPAEGSRAAARHRPPPGAPEARWRPAGSSQTNVSQTAAVGSHAYASLAAVRAAETGRPVLHAARTGTSAAYAADGRRLAWFDTDRVVEVSLPLATRTTPYDRPGAGVPAVAFAGLVRFIGRNAAARRRRRQ